MGIAPVSHPPASCRVRDIRWSSVAWTDYLQWQREDWAIVEKINTLLTECQRHPFTGTGKPEPLKRNLAGFWSRRITQQHRLVYEVTAEAIYVATCRDHY